MYVPFRVGNIGVGMIISQNLLFTSLTCVVKLPTEIILREKGRITIPATVRRVLGMREGEKLNLETKNGSLILRKKNVVTADQVKGIMGRGRVKIEEIEDALSRGVA
jgi:AbrB family looped-hinge helix DNA binding protein